MEGASSGPERAKGWRRWSWGALLAAGLLLREAFSFWTGHPYDFEIWVRTGYEVAHGANPYVSFWPTVPGSFTYPNSTLPSAAYPPLWSALLGGLYALWEHVGGGNRFVLYFLLKQPPIWADLLSAYLLYRLVDRWTGDRNRAKLALAFWAFFPYTILITAVWGQFDSMIVDVLLGLLWVGTAFRRNLLDGLGILLKWLTLIYLPLEAFRQRGFRRLWCVVPLAVAIGASGAIFLAFGWHLVGFTATVSSESRGGFGGMNYVRLLTTYPVGNYLGGIPYAYTILPYAWVPVVVWGGWVARSWVTSGTPRGELRAVLFILSLFLLARWGLNEQYWIYLFAPLLLDVVVFHPGRRALLYWLIFVASLFLVINNTLLFWFAAPVNEGLWTLAVHVDGDPIIGPIRQYGLNVLAAIITVSLVQVVWVFYKDETQPAPWLYGNLAFWRPSPAPTEVPEG